MARFERSRNVLLTTVLLVVLLPMGTLAGQQKQQDETPVGEELWTLFHAARYNDVLARYAAAQEQGTISVEQAFVTALTHRQLKRSADAQKVLEPVASKPKNDPWRHIARAALAIEQGRFEEAQSAAARAVELAPSLREAYYQLGMVQSYKRDFAAAAAAFRMTVDIDPAFAYAHYYAGLSFYRLKKIAEMARHFDAFVELAPNAPERPQVESIMRTVRG